MAPLPSSLIKRTLNEPTVSAAASQIFDLVRRKGGGGSSSSSGGGSGGGRSSGSKGGGYSGSGGGGGSGDGHKKKLKPGAIVGIVLGILAILALSYLIYYLNKRKRNKNRNAYVAPSVKEVRQSDDSYVSQVERPAPTFTPGNYGDAR